MANKVKNEELRAKIRAAKEAKKARESEEAKAKAVAESDMTFSVDGDLLANALETLVRIDESPLYIFADSTGLEFKILMPKFGASKRIVDGFETRVAGDFAISNKGAKILAKVIDKDDRYTFTAKENLLTISGCDQNFTLQGKRLNAVEYNRFFSMQVQSGNVITLPQTELARLLNNTLYATSNDDSRPIFQNANFKSEYVGSLVVTATDTNRLAMATTSNFSAQDSFDINIRADVLKFILPLLQQGDVQITNNRKNLGEISIDTISISFDNFNISAPCVVCAFPDCTKVILSPAPVVTTVNRAELINALKLCEPFANKHKAVTLHFESDGALKVRSEKENEGSAQRLIEAQISGVEWGNAEAEFNVTRLLAMLKKYEVETITICLTKLGLRICNDSLVSILSAMKNSVVLPEQIRTITPSAADVSTIDVTESAHIA